MSFATRKDCDTLSVVRARLIDQRNRKDILRAQALEPADADIPRALMIVIRRGGELESYGSAQRIRQPFDAT